MAPLSTTLLLPLLSLIPLATAHGHVHGIVVDGQWSPGWDAAMRYQNPIPEVAGWQADNLDNGFISPSAFGSADIICHKAATNGKAYVTARPGSKVEFQWNTWPESHKGPIIDYIASCNGDCTTVDKSSLRFTKFKEGGWKSGSNPGTWVTDDLIRSNFTWSTTIPSNLAPGNYVIRHEIIALHAAGQTNGAQAYPQCINFKIEGSGSQSLSGGTPATSFYKASDPGIVFNLYGSFSGYTIPGPALSRMSKRAHAREFE